MKRMHCGRQWCEEGERNDVEPSSLHSSVGSRSDVSVTGTTATIPVSHVPTICSSAHLSYATTFTNLTSKAVMNKI